MTQVKDKAELVRQKIEVDDRLARAKIKLQTVRSNAARRRVFMDPNEYRKLETRIQNLKQESQLLQLEIGGVSGPKPRAFETCFFVEARRLLAPDVFQSIFDAAKEKSAT